MAWIEPIIDRTLADTVYAKANRANPDSLKGMLNASDLNRIASNYRYVNDVLHELQNGTTITQKGDWIRGEDMPQPERLQPILDDIKALRNIVTLPEVAPMTPSFPIARYQKINDIEKIALILKDTIPMMVAEYIFSDEISSGEGDFV